MRENKSLEIKEDISATFLKTVSAFANYGEGVIMFGIADDGTVVGMKDPLDACLRIENMINDNIDPHPDFTIEIDEKIKVVKLTVEEGVNKPYLYKGKAYKRNDSSTIAVDRFELGRLVLSGSNISYDSTPSKYKDLTFNYLAAKFKSVLKITDINLDIMKTLALYDDKNGYSIAGELFADNNSFKGIDKVDNHYENIERPLVVQVEHEKHVTNLITNLYDLARKQNEVATKIFLEKLINEQVEEEKRSRDLLKQYEFVKDCKPALLDMDKSLASRE